MNKSIIISIVLSGILVILAILITNDKITFKKNESLNIPINNVSIVDGKQIIEIRAKGGYEPRVSYAKAGIPTVLRFDTEGTFDCSAIVRIPSMNISKSLVETGKTDIDLGIQEVGTFDGSCGMGMYPFKIIFQ